MEKIFLASHGSLATGMASAVEMILGKDPRLRVYDLDAWESPSRILEEVKKELDGSPAAFICDIRGGSVHNHLMELCTRPDVFLVTGMNLCMLLELLTAQQTDGLKSRCLRAVRAGADGICFFDREVARRELSRSETDEL